jgi:hypothetical protein
MIDMMSILQKGLAKDAPTLLSRRHRRLPI